MKKVLIAVSSLMIGGLAWAASNSACIFNLIPPTSAATAVWGDDSTITISQGKSPVAFIYNALMAVWMEISKQ